MRQLTNRRLYLLCHHRNRAFDQVQTLGEVRQEYRNRRRLPLRLLAVANLFRACPDKVSALCKQTLLRRKKEMHESTYQM